MNLTLRYLSGAWVECMKNRDRAMAADPTPDSTAQYGIWSSKQWLRVSWLFHMFFRPVSRFIMKTVKVRLYYELPS